MGVSAASPQLSPMLALPSATDILLWWVTFIFAFYGIFHVVKNENWFDILFYSLLPKENQAYLAQQIKQVNLY